jgi:hypothetical protein
MVTLLPFTFPGVHEGDAKVNDYIKSVSVSVRKEKSRVEFIALVLHTLLLVTGAVLLSR